MSSKWTRKPLGEIIRLQRGHDLPSQDRINGPVPVMGSAGITGYHNVATTKGPGIVIGRSGVGSMGVVSFADHDFWALNTTLYVTDFMGNDERFVYYLLRTLNFRQFDTGSAQASLNRNLVYPYEVWFPKTVTEQRQIAKLLGSLDSRITLLRETNATLEAIAHTLFKSWFVNFDPVHAKQKGLMPKGVDEGTAEVFPDSFEESVLGTVPKGWKVDQFGNWIEVLETGRRPKGGVSGIDEGIPSIGAESIVRIGQFDFAKTKFVSPDFFAKMKSGALQSHDVLLYKDGGKPGVFLPRVSMFGNGFPFEQCGINEHVFRIRVRIPLNQTFLYFWLWSDAIMHELKHRGGKAAIPGINQSDVKDLKIVIPNSEVLRKFGELTEPMIHQILSNAKQIQNLTNLRDSLLPRLISGQLRIPSCEDKLEEIEA